MPNKGLFERFLKAIANLFACPYKKDGGSTDGVLAARVGWGYPWGGM